MGHNLKPFVILCLFLAGTPLFGDILVFTFDDYNNNGLKDPDESLVSGLQVFGVDTYGNEIPFLDDGNGSFTLPSAVIRSRIRIHVLGYDDQLFAGKNRATSIFFALDGDSFNVPVLRDRPLDPNTTQILIPCYEKGASALKKDSPAFVRFPFAARGIAAMFGGDGPNPIRDATISQLGSTWGVTYQRSHQRAFAAALLKRHVGLGPEGMGAVYTLDYHTNPPTIGHFNLQDVTPATGPTIDLGSVRREIVDREIDETMPYALSTIEDRTRRASYDIDAFDKVGMTGFGDIEMAEDGRTLWMVNVQQRSLISMDVGDDTIEVRPPIIHNYPISELPGLPNLFFRYRNCINAGGNSNANGAEAFTDSNHVSWDKNKYSIAGLSGFTQAPISNTLNNAGNTSSAELYQSFRRGDFSYDIPVPIEEEYTVYLHFAEPEQFVVGDRLFDIYQGDQLVVENFDIVKHAGDARKATVLQLRLSAVEGEINLSFKSKFGAKRKEALLAGIEIIGQKVSESGVLRPWAIEFHEGRGYLGVISDASFSQSREHLFAYVLSFDPSDVLAGFREELAFPLNYPRERASNAQLKTPQTLRSAAWMPWVASWEETMIPTQGEALNVQNGLLCAYAQPILSKISFAGDGSITLGLMDRWAHQTGHLNYSTRLGDRTLVIGYAAGDLIKVFRSANGLYIVEQSNSDDGIYYRKDDGPSYHGEFYYEENFISPLAHHGEIVTGGQAILPGSNTVAVTVHSPIVTKNPYFQYDGLLTQGLHFYDMNTGKRTGEYLFVEQFVLGKANGLGDIAIAEDAAPPAVGNYVWCDANGNGIQDPTEYGMDGIEVSLHDEENALVALSQKTTTDGGQYYFDNLLPNHLYELRIDLDQLINKGYSGVASPLHSRSSLIDSDGDDVTLPGYAIIEFMTGNDGQNRDDLDFGFLGPLALDAQKILCENVSILPPNLPCADFSLADVKSCATSSSTNTVQIFPSFDDAEDRTREILNDIRVCGMDSIVFARVSVSGDPNCFAISRIDLMVQPGAGGLIVDFVEIVCPSDPFDLLAYLQSQGFRGDQTTQFYTDPAHMMTYMGDPMSVLPSSFPFILYYDDTIVEGGCGVPGSITLIEIPETEIFAGNDTSLCGLDCIDLTLLQPYFYANGTGATEAIWTSSGTGIFVDDATFANAHFYCPDANDLAAGQVVLSLTVTDDPCAVVAPSSSVLIYLTAGTPSFLEVPRDTIDCYHPFAIDPASFDTFPGCQLVLECIDTLVGEVVDYEIILGDCENIIKQVKRTLRFQYEKEEYFCMDTITVRALPDTVICPPMRDSVYCVPGYLKDENGHPSPMQTGVPMAGEVPLWPPLPSDCDILVTYKDVEFGGICPATIRREWLIKNSCTGAFDSCTQWIMIFDTTAPVITKLDTAAFITPIPSGSHHCEAEIRVPGIMVEDTCSGVKQVKGMINGQVIELVFNSISGYYESPVLIKVPVSEIDPLHDYYNISYVSYEVIDSCHNRSLVDSLPLYVVDKTKPVAICDKGLNITVADSTVWLPVSIFDEGSWDNCGIGLLLARRVDWATACGMNLCDSLLFVGIDEHHDSLFTAVLEENRHLNPLEAHYSETIKWLCEQGGICSYPVLLGWAYDLMRYAVKDCREHPYAVNDQYIQDLIRSWLPNVDSSLWLATVFSCLDTNSTPIYGSTPGLNDAFVVGLNETLSLTDIYEKSSLLDLGVKLGGGWSAKVPFCCEDACQDIMVELLVMDYWCNWSKCWTTVRVEDKTPPIVINDLADVSITCSAYEQFYASSVHLAQQGIFDSLQIKLGGYDHISKRQSTTVGVDNYQLLNLVCDSVLVTYDSLVYDEHAGYVWKTYQSYQTEYRQETDTRFRGQVADNCGLISWEENPWISLDDCGTGFIKRTFKFVGQCGSGTSGHVIDTISRQQIIWVTNDCVLSKSMFNFPKDTVVNSCEIEFSDDGSGNVGAELSPDFLGRATYLLSADCRRVGIGYYDKVFKIVGGNQACYKILRTWCLADWCLLASSEKEGWWFEKQYAGKYLSYTQKIIVVDSTAPICNILDLPGEVYTHGCDYTIEARLAIEAYCGSVDYRWQILNQKTQLVVGKGMGSSNTVEQGIIIEAESLEPGDYLLKAVVVDDCQNESWCQQEFKVISNNKPTPVCVTSISVELTPMDTNGDGLVDTAMAIIMASDFNQSSLPACGSSVSGLQYRIDFAHIDPMLPGSDAHQISLGCLHIGVNALHLFVIDENGQWDYCSVNVVVQPNMGGCTDDIIGGVKGNTSNIPVKVNATDFQLHQNVPNPFHGETTIGFNVSRNGVARLSIFDVHGRILYDRSDMASTGYNEWKITGLSNFDVSALLYYKLEYQDRVAVRKMLLLR